MMKNPKTPAPPLVPKQLKLWFDAGRTARLGGVERHTVVLALAQILMQAAGLAVEELADDER
jgi:hypothetical protein